MVRSVTTMTFDTLRRLESFFCKSKEKSIILQVHPDVARRLRGENKNLLDDIIEGNGREIAIESVSDFHIHDTAVLSARSRQEVAHY
jgi:Ribonuclease G/E